MIFLLIFFEIIFAKVSLFTYEAYSIPIHLFCIKMSNTVHEALRSISYVCLQLHLLFQGTYGKARDEAKKQIRFLLIYLHDSGSEETELFCRDTLCHPLSVEFLNRKVIFWGCSIAKPEGYKGIIVSIKNCTAIARVFEHRQSRLAALFC